ncbi:RPA-related protein RADX, partial [Bombina bombina]|uniref:RPA-related protein RADX n=1 Tax=Bombina bombina TaxID=8345 RepID=UPI00235AED89
MQDPEFTNEGPGPSCTGASGFSFVPGPGAASWILTTKEALLGCPNLRLVLSTPVSVAVLAIERYLGEVTTSSAHYYDVTLSDGIVWDTWHLSPEHNPLVHSNRLRCGIWLQITQCSYCYYEKKLNGGLVRIDELKLGEVVSAEALTELCKRPQHVLGSGAGTPLLGDRRHYLPLWNNVDPYGEAWQGCKTPQTGSMEVSKVSFLQNLEMNWKFRKALPPLIVRIMHKSRLRYFGKSDKKIDIPYQAYFEVADHSGMMSLVLWNCLCLEWFHTFRVGTVLFLQQYALKKSYPNRTLPTPGDSQMKRLRNLEISLNSWDPPSSFHVVQENQVKPEWRLPEVKYQFCTRLELNDLPHNQACDVIGIVTYVGRCERKRKDDSEEFWQYRWVQMTDGTTDQPFLLEIYATSQPEIFENIHPMTYLVCTQMRVVREFPDDPSCTVYLTTSNETQVFITGHHKGQPYTVDNKVKSFIHWTKTQSEAELMKRTIIGGYHRYPLTPSTFSVYCKDNKVELMLSTFNELKKTIAELQYRETRRIAVRGMIAALRFVNSNSVAIDTSEKEMESIDLTSLQESSVSFVENTGQLLEEHHRAHKQSVLPTEKRPGLQQNTGEQYRENLSKKSPVRSRKRLHQPDVDHFSALENNSLNEVNHDLYSRSNEFKSLRGNDVSFEIEMKENPKNIWESELWSAIKGTVAEHLHYSHLPPESIPRKFDYFSKDFLMQLYNLQPSKVLTKKYRSDKEIGQFSTANSLGYYELTILGINQTVAIDVVYLPETDDHHVFGINPLSSMHQLSYGIPGSEHIETNVQGKISAQDELLKIVNMLDRVHTICILDVCHLGDNKVEVCLNRVYHSANSNEVNN